MSNGRVERAQGPGEATVIIEDTVVVIEEAASTGANTSVAGTVVNSTTILAAFADRLFATIFNDSSAVLYLSLGPVCTPTNFTIKMVAGSYYEIPYNRYTGIITGVWDSATGNARVTQLSP